MILPLLSCQFSTHQKPAPHLPHRHTMHAGDRYALFYPTDARGIKKLALLVTYCYFRSVTALRRNDGACGVSPYKIIYTDDPTKGLLVYLSIKMHTFWGVSFDVL